MSTPVHYAASDAAIVGASNEKKARVSPWHGEGFHDAAAIVHTDPDAKLESLQTCELVAFNATRLYHRTPPPSCF
jgi:hypothetical protein